MDFKFTLLIFIVTSPLCFGKPLCDLLEDYYRNSKQPGSRRLMKTVRKICTAFDVIKYDGIDLMDLIFPPIEDDDDIGTPQKKRKENDGDDDSQEYELSPRDRMIQAAVASRFAQLPIKLPARRFRDWRAPRPHLRPQYRVSDRRHHKVKSALRVQTSDEKVTKMVPQNDSAEDVTPTRFEEAKSPTPKPMVVVNQTDSPIDENEYEDDEDYLDDDDNDPVLSDLADFVASVRFLSLNDTTHLNVIFPPSQKYVSEKVDSGRPALAIEAPEELLPSKYRDVFPAIQKESSLPDVFRIYTEFSCDEQRFKPGVYADVMTECKAFHLCLPPGHGFSSATFLCPRNLRYDQRLLRCDWGGAVNCSDSTRHFINNKHFRHNYTAYLQSLHTLLHGDGESTEVTEEKNFEAIETTTRKTSKIESALNIALLGKLRKIISSE